MAHVLIEEPDGNFRCECGVRFSVFRLDPGMLMGTGHGFDPVADVADRHRRHVIETVLGAEGKVPGPMGHVFDVGFRRWLARALSQQD